ncbi:MAG: DUF512 domain-containing protein [Oscillospiraceae bacterium]
MSKASAISCVHRHGTRIFFCGDEMYIKAGRELPDEDIYEEIPSLKTASA